MHKILVRISIDREWHKGQALTYTLFEKKNTII